MPYVKKLSCLALALLVSCAGEKEATNETILARIGEKTISVNEFIRRAEYTIRPAWCKSDDYIARKVVLNSLIAEKLLAIEAGNPAEISNNEEISLYLQGRKEQAMRKIHFTELGTKKVNLNEVDLEIPQRMAERTYNVTIIPINNDNLASRIKDDLRSQKTNFDALASEFSLALNQELTEQKIAFDSPVNDELFKSLFLNETQDDQVIGPLKIDKNQHVLVKVNGWIRRPVISDKDALQLQNDVKQKVTEVLAKDIYVDWIAENMKGKKLDFNAGIFEKLVNIVGPDYFKTEKNKEEAFKKRFWNKDNSEMILNDTGEQWAEILDEPFLTIDNETWTVRRFENEIKKHPLVFRNPKMPKSDFTNEFRLAVADLIRDVYTTQDAYKKGLDKDPRVIRDKVMWEDNILALYQQNKLLSGVSRENLTPMIMVSKHLNPVIEDLRKKYQDKIFINTDEFEKIHLTSVDMFVIQKNMPFPVVVPQFPILTTHNKLDYGSKMSM